MIVVTFGNSKAMFERFWGTHAGIQDFSIVALGWVLLGEQTRLLGRKDKTGTLAPLLNFSSAFAIASHRDHTKQRVVGWNFIATGNQCVLTSESPNKEN